MTNKTKRCPRINQNKQPIKYYTDLHKDIQHNFSKTIQNSTFILNTLLIISIISIIYIQKIYEIYKKQLLDKEIEDHQAEFMKVRDDFLQTD